MGFFSSGMWEVAPRPRSFTHPPQTHTKPGMLTFFSMTSQKIISRLSFRWRTKRRVWRDKGEERRAAQLAVYRIISTARGLHLSVCSWEDGGTLLSLCSEEWREDSLRRGVRRRVGCSWVINSAINSSVLKRSSQRIRPRLGCMPREH